MSWEQPGQVPESSEEHLGNRRRMAALSKELQAVKPLEPPYYWYLQVGHVTDQDAAKTGMWRVAVFVKQRRKWWFDKYVKGVYAGPEVDDEGLLRWLTTDKAGLWHHINIVADDLVAYLKRVEALEAELESDGER